MGYRRNEALVLVKNTEENVKMNDQKLRLQFKENQNKNGRLCNNPEDYFTFRSYPNTNGKELRWTINYTACMQNIIFS